MANEQKDSGRNTPIDWSDHLAKLIADTILSCVYYLQNFVTGLPLMIAVIFITWLSWDSVLLPLFGRSVSLGQLTLIVLMLRVVLGPPYISVTQPLSSEEKALLLRFESATLNNKHLRIVEEDRDVDDGA